MMKKIHHKGHKGHEVSNEKSKKNCFVSLVFSVVKL
jgi:hypothetical protein